MPKWDPVEDYVENSNFWNDFIHREELKSTSSFLRDKDFDPGTVVLADEQTGGRGRGSNRWYSPEGGLWFSFKVTDSGAINPQKLYVKILGTLRELLADGGVITEVSRPNDLVAEGKKIAGILIEEKDSSFIIGLGINVNNDLAPMPDELREESTTMKEMTGREISRVKLLEGFLARFEEFYRD